MGASPFYGQATYAGVYNGVTYTGAAFNQLPALAFTGADAGVCFNNFSPRLGLTYDLRGNGRNVVKFNYAHYVGQLGTGNLSSTYNTVRSPYVRYPWVDVNGDRFIQANEIVMTAAPLSWTTGYDYNNPRSDEHPGKVDPNLSSDTTDEFIVSFDKQIGNEFAVSASYIWRKLREFLGERHDNLDASNWTAVSWTPPATACPAGASCPAVTYYEPTSQFP